MAIKSHAFDRVTLTQEDAAEFLRQVKHGRTNATAKSTVERGAEMNMEFKAGGKVKVPMVREKEHLAS